MVLSYDTIDELIEAAGQALRAEQGSADADDCDILKTTPGDTGRQCNIAEER